MQCPIAIHTIPLEAPPPSPDVAALTAGMVRGVETAYRQFCALYFTRLLRYLLVLAKGNEATAKEALQLTLLRVVRHIRPFDSEEVLWSWLAVLAKSSLIDEERKRQRYRRLLDRFFLWARPIPAADPQADARLHSLLEINLASLPAEDRDLIERKYFSGESIHEIAAATGLTDKAIESRLGRLRRKLKEMILAQLKNET